MARANPKKRNLKPYLGMFYTQISKNDVEYLRETFPDFKNYFFIGNKDQLLKLGCYFLLNFGLQKYESYKSVELVDRYLGKDVGIEQDEIHSIYSDLLIVYHLKYTPGSSAKIEEVINYYVSERALHGLTTIVLSEAELKSVKDNSELEYVNVR